MDLSLSRIERALGEIDPVFLNTPQFVSDRPSGELGREVVIKVETVNPIGSFKGRGTSRLGQKLDEVVLVDDDDLRAAMALIADSTGVLVEPAGAASWSYLPFDPDSDRARSMSSLTPNPVGPFPTYSRPTSHAVPAMSRWTHGLPSTNSSRNDPA